MEREPDGLEIEGKTYPVPTIDTFDIAEARILKRYSGAVLEDFSPVHPNASKEEKAEHEGRMLRMLSDPDFKAAFAHIAFRRGNPDREYEDIAAVVDKLSLVGLTLALFEEDDASPPEMTSASELEKPSNSSQHLSPLASGSPSSTDSDPQDGNLSPTGTSESDTSSQVSLVGT